MHALPAAPHADPLGVLQVFAAVQHPDGHDAGLQMHCPLEHSCPLPHGVPPPHWHTPAAHRSAVDPHEKQAPPPTPHWAVVAGAQVVPVQHPLGQVLARHAGQLPALHASGAQLWHAAPPEPQAPLALPAWQVEPEQQPAHEVLSQTHCPARQCCPAAHGGPPPQVHAPAGEQPSAVFLQSLHAKPTGPQAADVVGDVQVVPAQHPPGQEAALQMHAPLAQTCPAPQAAPEPQWQAPDKQLSAFAGSHATQAPPAVPQLDTDGAWQVEFEQHPLAHDVASQPQWPPEHP